jgi:hypothetical protein
MLARPLLGLLILCVPMHLSGQSQWVRQTTGIYGGQVTALTSCNGNIFAGTNNGVYRSQNNGADWSPVNTGLNGKSVNDLAATGSTVYVAIQVPGGGVISSTDNGDSWNAVPFGAPIMVTQLATVGSQLFAMSSTFTLYTYSGSGGGTIVNHGIAGGATEVAASGLNLFLASESGLYVSTNLGVSWNLINLGIGTYSSQTLRASGNKLLVWIFYGGSWHSFVSMDGGTTWIDAGLDTSFAEVGALDNGNVLVGRSYGPAKISSDGISWNDVFQFDGMTSTVSTVGGQFAGTVDGVFRTTNGGVSWVTANTGLTARKIDAMTLHDKKIFAASGKRILVSGDGALSWMELNGIVLGFLERFRCMGSSGPNLLVGVEGGTYGSTDDGATWFTANPNLNNVSGFVTIGENVYAANQDGIYISDDNGRNWRLYAALSLPTSISSDGTNIYATANGAFRIGVTGVVTRISNGIPVSPGETFMSIASVGNKLICGTLSDGFYISDDAGVSWNHVNGIPPINTGRVLFVDGTNVYATLDEYGVYRSTDMGATWTEFNNGFDPAQFYGYGTTKIQSMISFEGRLLAGLSGVWAVCTPPKPTITTSIVNQAQVLSAGGGSALNQWFFNGNSSPVATGLSLTPSTKGRYSVKIIYPNGCSSEMSDEFMFNPCAIMPKPVISAAGLNSPTPRLTSSAAAGNQWYLNGALIFGATTYIFDPVQPGTYTVKVASVSLGCSLSSDDFVVACAMPKPLISVSTDAGTQFVSSSATGNQWYINGKAVDGATASKITASQSGVYTVTVSVTTGCSRSSEGITFTGDLTTDQIEYGIRIFPNPTTNLIYIDLDAQKFSTRSSVHLSIIDSMGRLMTTVEGTAGERVPLDVSGYSFGAYLVRAAQGDEKRMVRFVKGE